MTDTRVKESFRQRRVGGGLLVFIALPLTLFAARFGLGVAQDLLDILLLLGGPALLLLGLWAAFPMRAPQVRLTMSDDALRVHKGQQTVEIELDAVLQVKKSRPPTAKFDRLTFVTSTQEVVFDVIQLTHEADEIINLMSIRLEERGRYLREGVTGVLGSRNGIWEVIQGNPFEKSG